VAETITDKGETVTRAFFNHNATFWDEVHTEKNANKLAAMAARLEIQPGAAVLDVGSGTGCLLPFLRDKVGPEGWVVALDYAEEMLRQARLKYDGEKIYYLHADVASMPLSAGSFDGVVCYSSLPHFQDKPRALREIYRVTKDGGRLFICHTSSRSHINGVHHRIPCLANDALPDNEELRMILAAAGFGDIQIEDSTMSYLATARKP
jgi:ubiquinone/menaquinone biosynthesis C-methylase UbiE